jgi:polar amino acid transport system substrate-binding protein
MRYPVVALLVGALAMHGLSHAAERSVQFVTDSEKEGGWLVEVTTEALRRMNYDVTIRYMPWARALQTVSAGQAEALLGAYYTRERAAKMLFTASIGSSDIVFFKLRTSNITYQRLEDLAGHVIGTINGAAYTPEFDHAAFLRKEPAQNFNTNIKKLLIGRVELVLEKRSVVVKALQELSPQVAEQIVALDKPLVSAQFYNAFSLAYPDAERKVADFNAGLALMTSDGTLQKILAKNLHE